MTINTQLHAQLTELFATKLNLDVPSADTDLMETGMLDSLALVDLLVHLEQEFGVQISLDVLEIDNFRSIRTIADFISVYGAADEMAA
jgi:acyl carrier protein